MSQHPSRRLVGRIAVIAVFLWAAYSTVSFAMREQERYTASQLGASPSPEQAARYLANVTSDGSVSPTESPTSVQTGSGSPGYSASPTVTGTSSSSPNSTPAAGTPSPTSSATGPTATAKSTASPHASSSAATPTPAPTATPSTSNPTDSPIPTSSTPAPSAAEQQPSSVSTPSQPVPTPAIRWENPGKSLSFSGGGAEPNSKVQLEIRSDPLVVELTADKDGNWTYVLEYPLKEGGHSLTVQYLDATTRQPVSTIHQFFIPSVAAASSLNGSASIPFDPLKRLPVTYAATFAGMILFAWFATYKLYRRQLARDESLESTL